MSAYDLDFCSGEEGSASGSWYMLENLITVCFAVHFTVAQIMGNIRIQIPGYTQSIDDVMMGG